MANFPFGLDRDRLQDQFDAIAEGLKNGDCIPRAVSYLENETDDEFVTRTISLTFNMRKDSQVGSTPDKRV